jgi:AcrR family transcriptional regulator
MTPDTMTKISAGLETAFARHGFATPSVEDLRDAASVSLRTLYKYLPSRADMVLAALQHRHQRYLAHLFDGLPPNTAPDTALTHLIRRVGSWMQTETAHGCLFHGAVAADPQNQALKDLLQRHKAEVAQRAASASSLEGHELALLQIFEGLTQTWALHPEASIKTAEHLAGLLQAAKDQART